MSYEGYYQTLCEKGHLGPDIPCQYSVEREQDIIKGYTCTEWVDGKPCGASLTWVNSVDDTNCDSQGYHFMEQLTEQVTKTCDLGHEHVWTAATYKPSENSYWYDQEKGWVETRRDVCPDCGSKDAHLHIRKDDASDTWRYCIPCSNKKNHEAWKRAQQERESKMERLQLHCTKCSPEGDQDTEHVVLRRDDAGFKTRCTRCERETWR